jgi:DNA-binding NarL/FixJ family response regulator
MTRHRILLADDNPEMRERVASLLQSHFDVVGSVENGEQAIESAVALNPDVLLLDISMPIFNGIEVASRLRDLLCRVRVVFVTVHQDRDYVEAAFSLGAFGYVLKRRIDSDLIPALQGALEGRMFVSPFQTRHPGDAVPSVLKVGSETG